MQSRRLASRAFGQISCRVQWFGRLNDDPGTWTDLTGEARTTIAEALLPPLLDPVRPSAVMAVRPSNRSGGFTTVRSSKASCDTRIASRCAFRSQAGCGMNCPFCATGQAGLTRNLSTAEIVEQVLAGSRMLARGEVAVAPDGFQMLC